RGLFPVALADLRAGHPGLRVRSQELEPEDAARAVLRGDLDLAVVLDWYDKPLPVSDGLAKASLLDDPADVMLPAGHPLAGRAEIELEELADDDWISWPEGAYCQSWLMYTLRAKDIEPRICHYAEEHHTQLALVAAGLGVCVTPRLGRGVLPEGVRVVPVRQSMRRHVYVVWRADADRRPSIRAAVDALRSAGEAIG
ncbi:LysR substrate-binding domain-containing protein, partial [Streptomyces sp. T-3]|nr:LysR substrate-binding domain-containing protein [Streptomyces sp. T-3]